MLTIVLTLAALAAEPAPPDVATKLTEYAEARAKVSKFSGALLVARDSRPLLRQAYGMANYELDVPNTPTTKFRIGSVTKQFTATAVLILEERGKLKVTDTLGSHLPDCPKAWADVTLHHLLSHTAGIPEHTIPGVLPGIMTRTMTPRGIVDTVKDKPLDFTPGEKWKYSNTGYVLLGMVIEKASGQGYADFLKGGIFDPLGMADTGYERRRPILKQRASGYGRAGGEVVNAAYIDMTVPFAAGALYSTLDDLLRWDRALATDQLLPAAAREKMFTPVKDDYGYGWGIKKRFGRTVQSHGGGIPGFRSVVARYPDENLFVAVLANVEDAPVQVMANDLAAIVLGEKYELPRERKAP
jgi:CubicO group peptidase (beta-lactamase class C family)